MRLATRLLRFLLIVAVLGLLSIATELSVRFLENQYPQSKILAIHWPEDWAIGSCKNTFLPSHMDIEYRSSDASPLIQDWYRQRYNNFPQDVTLFEFLNIYGFLSQELYLPPNRTDQNEERPTSFIITISFLFCTE